MATRHVRPASQRVFGKAMHWIRIIFEDADSLAPILNAGQRASRPQLSPASGADGGDSFDARIYGLQGHLIE